MFGCHHGMQVLRVLRDNLISRNIHINQQLLNTNFYDALGIHKASTQAEIKAAYYKLSMLYHPDKNQGSDSAAIKFREITKAYEVLGNYRLRRLYDKGIIHTAGPEYAQHTNMPDDMANMHAAETTEDDPETKFYKSRFKRSQVADAKGRTPIYNFDEWSKCHYGKSFERRQNAKRKFEHLQTQKSYNITSFENDIVLLSFLFAGVAVYWMFVAETSYDTPKEIVTEHAEHFSKQDDKDAKSNNSSDK